MIFTVLPGQPAVKLADLKNTKGCYGLDLQVVTYYTGPGMTIVFAIGGNAQNSLNTGIAPVFIAGRPYFNGGFYLPDGDGALYRNFRQFADELWVKNLSGGIYQVDVQPYRIG